MKISYNWLENYLNVNLPAEEVAVLLTDIGLEVEGIEKVESIKGRLKGVVIGKVITKIQHPNADRLTLTTVDVGVNAPLQIVCGAPNVAVGQKVPVATIGTLLYDGDESIKIKKGKIRGEVSMGMICAEDELGLGKEHDGIMVLDAKAKVGTSAGEYFKLESDVVFEIGTGLGILTPLLCKKAQKVISIDADENLIKKAKSEFSTIDNLVLKSGDGFKHKGIFSIFVSNLPYSKSKDAIEWLAQNSFSHGIIMVQKEFAEKLLATSKNRRSISIIATHAFDIVKISDVGKNNFSPPPKIDSIIFVEPSYIIP